VLGRISQAPNGLILVTGPTGNGKSTTLASMIRFINDNFNYNVITIEDPIEFLFSSTKSCVIQREVGIDTDGFGEALKAAMRMNPDVIMVGELRDLETIDACVKAAETGHLVLSSLHTHSAASTISTRRHRFLAACSGKERRGALPCPGGHVCHLYDQGLHP
jgi:twitching motility protein PilT